MAVSTQLLVGIAIIYLALILGIGYYGYKRTKSADDYMVAGRNTPPLVLALSYGATFISTSAIVGFGGMAAQYGMSLMWLTVLCIVVGVIIAFLFFGKRVRRKGKELGAMTYPELLGKIFASKKIIYGISIIFVASMPLYTAAAVRFHLLMKPANPGTPIRPSADPVKVPKTIFMVFPRPSIS